jgi:hypothetical protein
LVKENLLSSAITCLAQAVLGGCFFMGKFKTRKIEVIWRIFLHFLADFQHDNLLGEEELNERAGWLPLASVILAFIGECYSKDYI